nr:hypothetical protein [Massilia sp. PDC64]
MKAILKALIIWMTLLTLPLQGFAAATVSCCVPPTAAAQIDHDHDAMANDDVPSAVRAYDEHAGPGIQTDHHPAAHHHAGKCATCGTCGSCVPMAPMFVAVLPVSASQSITVPFDQRTLTSVDLAHPERPPSA